MFKISLSIFFSFSILASAAADPGDWQDGVYIAPPVKLFAGRSKSVVDFVKSHPDQASLAVLYLTPCPSKEAEDLCSENQTRFVLDYIAAFYNDLNSQENVAYDLSGRGMPPKSIGEGNMQAGIAPDLKWGCAWRIAILTSGDPAVDDGDMQNFMNDCEEMSLEEQESSNVIAIEAIVPRIHTFMAAGTLPYSLVDDYPASP